MKVLLVDDEKLSLEYMKSLIDWDQCGHQLSGIYSDPYQALQFLDRESVDLLITDIRMPKMDGIELGRHLHRIAPQTLLVLLTGYKDFEYARSALEIHADDFLLKDTLDQKTFEEMLARCERKLQHSALLRLWNGEQTLRNLHTSTEKSVFAEGKLSLCALLFPTPILFFRSHEWMKHSKNKLDIEDFQIKGLIPMVYPIENGWLIGAWQKVLRKRGINMETVVRMLKERTDRDLYVIEPLQAQAPIQAGEIIEQMIWLSNHTVFFSKEKTLHLPALVVHQADRMEQPEKLFPPIVDAWNADDEDDLLVAMGNVFHPFKSCWDLSAFQMVCDQTVAFLDPLLLSHSLPSVREREQLLPGTCYDVDQVTGFFIAQFQSLFRQRRQLKTFTRSPLLNKAFKWMSQEYMNDISLGDVAQQLGISKVYLSQLFRKQADTTFVEALTKIRLEVAKYLLKDTKMKIYEIAHRTGFQKSQYFCQVFKNETKMTPVEYRNQKGER